MTIIPDTKDWTWVLQRPCPECGFDTGGFAVEAVPGMILANAAAWQDALAGPHDPDGARARPEPGTWSPLEYACHLRDVLLVQRERVLAARRVDRPVFDPMGRDERVEHDGYAGQDSQDVARQLVDAAAMFANDLDRLTPADWDRTVMYSYPKRWERSLRWVAVHTLHEVYHHTMDINRGVAAGEG